MIEVVRRWHARLWWLLAPWTVLLATMDVWAHTIDRYLTGAYPQQFGMYFGHGDELLLLLIAFCLYASAAWLVIGVLLVVPLLRRRHLSRVLTFQGLVLIIALCLLLPQVHTWDQLLLKTVGPGKAAGNLLVAAVRQGDTVRVRQLLSLGIAPDAPNFALFGRGVQPFIDDNALAASIEVRQHKMVALLLEHGADASRPDHFGLTPLTRAVGLGDVETVRLLLQRGADPCAPLTYQVRTPSESPAPDP
jgi:hypothetical protein